MDLIITTEQRDALLAYLVKRPFEEVASAVVWLQQLPQAPPPPKKNSDRE